MNRRRIFYTIALLALLLAAALPAQAMQSAAYRMDWLLPLSGSGGKSGSAWLTFGQALVGVSECGSGALCAGFWCGAGGEYRLMLPLVTR